jgi:hypothetical protein
MRVETFSKNSFFLTLTLGCRKAFFNVENRLFAIFFIFISKYLILMR